MQITIFYIPVSTQSEATSLGRKAVENRLAACANIFPVQSIFPWEGSIQNEGENVLLLKTIPSLTFKLRDFFSEHHPYEVPCIMNWNVEVNEEYGKWIRKNVEV